MMESAEATRLILDKEIASYFSSGGGSRVPSLNLLSSDLPTFQEEIKLIQNNIDIALCIDAAQRGTVYRGIVTSFASKEAIYREVVASFAQRFAVSREAVLTNALNNCVSSVNIFSPLQCALACKGCYTNALPITKFPFTRSFVDSYYSGFSAILSQVKELGAKAIYTAGDGELLSFPRFFDMASEVKKHGIKWLFFTSGLNVSSEVAAESTCKDIFAKASLATQEKLRHHLSRSTTHKPYREALLAFLAEFSDILQIYHSVWHTDPAINTKVRHPLLGDYEYREVCNSNGRKFYLPSSVLDIRAIVYRDSDNPEFGIEMPVSELNEGSVEDVVHYVYENRLRSYLEPIMTTGRNKNAELADSSARISEKYSRVLVRQACGFRNLYQPTLKPIESNGQASWYSSPGMGVSIQQVMEYGAAATNLVDVDEGIFSSVFSPLNVYCNFRYAEGCKCNSFSKRLVDDRESLVEELTKAAAAYPRASLTDTISNLRTV